MMTLLTWADTSYKYKKKITIDHTKVSGDETDFPVLVDITHNDFKDINNGGHVQSSNGYDIVFYDSTETTLLYHEIEVYTANTGELVFWINIPSISSTENTIFYIYYGKSNVAIDPSSTSTWNSDFIAVWHFNNNANDSTSNGWDLTEVNSPSYSTQLIGGGTTLNSATSDAFTHATLLDVLPANGITYELLSKPTSITTAMYFYRKRSNADNQISCLWLAGTGIRFLTEANTNIEYIDGFLGSYLADNWYYIVHTHVDNTKQEGHLNTSKIIDDVNTGVIADGTSYNFYIGTSGSSSYYSGAFDETRISSKRRSDNWLETTYNTETSPDAFLSFGDEQTQEAIKTILHLGIRPQRTRYGTI
jgi:hypothetical protein